MVDQYPVIKFTLTAIRPETADVSSFLFSTTEPMEYRAGHHLSMMLPHEHPDERGMVRTFTISSSPTESFYSITTRRGPSSFKKALFSLANGSTVDIRHPHGRLGLDETNLGPRLMIAGGIGITPFRSIIKYTFDKKVPIPLTLLYSNKSSESIVFGKELDEIAGQQAHFKLTHTITRPQESKETWKGRMGRIDESLVKEHVGDPATMVYIAGPSAFVEGMATIVQALNVPPERMLFEKFSGY